MQWHTLQQDWGKSRQGEEKGGYEGGRRSVVLGVHLETKEKRKKGGRGGKGGGVHLTSARRCSSHATMPCCCVRSASMCMPMRGNVMCGISCHHHHDELFVCQCVLQPAIPVRMCVCLCVQRARQCRQQQESTHPKKKRERACV